MANTTVSPGLYTYRELFDRFGFDVEKEAAVNYESSGPGVDYRRVNVGGLSFDDLDQQIHIPEGAEKLEISLDDEVVVSAKVKAE